MSETIDTETGQEMDLDVVAAELKQLRSDFARLGDVLQSVLRRASRGAASEASEAGERIWSGAKGRAEDLAKTIQDEPLAFTFGALGVGFVLGLLIGGRR
jgi:ElaB/YqjD/DUF883 family membrane-anchored ribosome-binding protein